MKKPVISFHKPEKKSAIAPQCLTMATGHNRMSRMICSISFLFLEKKPVMSLHRFEKKWEMISQCLMIGAVDQPQ